MRNSMPSNRGGGISVWYWEMIPLSAHSPPQCGHRSGSSASTASSTAAGIGRRQARPYRSPVLCPGFSGWALGARREKGAACRFPARSASSNACRRRSFSAFSRSISRSRRAIFSESVSCATRQINRHHNPRDQVICFYQQARDGQECYFRRIEFYDEEQDRVLVFVTNHLTLAAATVAEVYKQRWQIEL